jgi:teichuronic acid biosynthesis glycosyltransferase TuaC
VTLDVVDRLPLDEMRAAYAASDALVLTSWQEGSPNCVKEALACAVPVVSVDVGDVRDVVEGMTNCAVVGPQPTEIARALAATIADGRGCPTGPARMAARYSMEAMAGEFLAMYRAVGNCRDSHDSLYKRPDQMRSRSTS